MFRNTSLLLHKALYNREQMDTNGKDNEGGQVR